MSLPPPSVPEPSTPSPSPWRSSVLRGLVIGVLVFAVGLAGVLIWHSRSGSSPAASTPATGATTNPQSPAATASPTAGLPTVDPALAGFYRQKIDWTPCERDFCGTLEVPLDYAHPAAGSIRLALLKVPAQDPAARIGSLVVNPGGPGGSGVDFAAGGSLQFGNALSAAFDIVGFDPRGVGRSDPLKCLDTSQMDAVLASDPDPDTAAERARLDALIRGFGQGCLRRSGNLARHISTEEAARDMDILRGALNEPRLNYLGASYGTFLGATYADLFPTHVGRFVLDGAIDPALSNEQLSLQQGQGFEVALRAYVADCVSQGACVLGTTVDQGVGRIQAFLRQLDAKPLPTGSSRPLTEGLGALGIWRPLYAKGLWPELTQALTQALGQGQGSQLLALADDYASRGPGSYLDNSIEVLYAVNCLDHSDSIPTSQVPAHFAEFQKASPTFGRAFAFSLSTCAVWPIHTGHVTRALHAAGAPPIVVVGTTRDPATPLKWAQALAAELDSGRLITRNGDGHTGFRQGNACVDNAVQAWLLHGTAPKRDLHC